MSNYKYEACSFYRTASLALAICLWILQDTQSITAAVVSFAGRAPISFSSSIPGIIKHDVFYFDLTLDDSVLDTDHRVFPNGTGGVTATGEFANAVQYFRIYAYPGNGGTYDPKDITFDYTNTMIRTVDAGPGPGTTFHNEHFQIFLHVSNESLSAGARFQWLMLNLYNGTIYAPYSEKQYLLDTSESGIPMSLADLFLHGTSSLENFLGVRPAQSVAGADGIFMEGLVGSGAIASGDGVSLTAVPEPSSCAIASLSVLFIAMRKRRGSREKS